MTGSAMSGVAVGGSGFRLETPSGLNWASRARRAVLCGPPALAAAFCVLLALWATGCKQDINDDLQQAALYGQPDRVAALLAKGANVEAVGLSGRTPLTAAAGSLSSKTVELLLAHGADVNRQDRGGRTALDTAVSVGTSPAIVRVLIAHGADVKSKPWTGVAVLSMGNGEWASRVGILEALIAAGAEVDRRNRSGDTPLLSAASLGLKNATRILLDHGADVNAADDDGITALSMAKYELKEHPGSHDRKEVVRILTAAGGLEEAGPEHRRGALDEMAALDAEELAVFLKRAVSRLDWGALDDMRRSVLVAAVALRQPEAFRSAAYPGRADPNRKTKTGATALMYAAVLNAAEPCKALLDDARTDLNAQDNHGQTALMLAALTGAPDCLNLLAKHGGVDANTRDLKGETALVATAAMGTGFGVVRTLMNFAREAQIGAAVSRTLSPREAVEILLAGGSGVDLADNGGRTPLMYAAWTDNAEIVGVLMKHGANPALRDRDGRRAIDWAQPGSEAARLLSNRSPTH